MSDIWTFGHWYYQPDKFLEKIKPHGIQMIVDVRSYPSSRRSPQYNASAMKDWLPGLGIGYARLGNLGGRRRDQGVNPSVNAGWVDPSFRHYADYMLSEDWLAGVHLLGSDAKRWRVAYMCGEPQPSRCHRLLISDWLTIHDWNVTHILPEGSDAHEPGRLGPMPELLDDGVRLHYPD